MISRDELAKIMRYDRITGVFKYHKGGTGRRASLVAGYYNPVTNRMQVNINRQPYLQHMLAWLYETGTYPKRNEIFFSDGDPRNMSFTNLYKPRRPGEIFAQSVLKDWVTYNPLSGNFHWRVDKTNGVKAGDIAGSKTGRGYIEFRICGKQYKAHRLAVLYQTGTLLGPKDEVDHIDHNRANNAWGNLRVISKRSNGMNQRRKSNNTTGKTGVTFNKKKKVWVARVQFLGKAIFLGEYPTFSEAVAVREQAEKDCGFHKNHGK